MKGTARLQILLASGSPARRTLLENTGYDVTQFPSGISEDLPIRDPAALALQLAEDKLTAACSRHTSLRCYDAVITADTVISDNGSSIGKPATRQDAAMMLQRFSGKTHRVISGYALYLPGTGNGYRYSGISISRVTFRSLPPTDIEEYLATGEWVGAAGAYRIQGRGITLISSIIGSYYTVVGLPLQDISGILRERGM